MRNIKLVIEYDGTNSGLTSSKNYLERKIVRLLAGMASEQTWNKPIPCSQTGHGHVWNHLIRKDLRCRGKPEEAVRRAYGKKDLHGPSLPGRHPSFRRRNARTEGWRQRQDRTPYQSGL